MTGRGMDNLEFTAALAADEGEPVDWEHLLAEQVRTRGRLYFRIAVGIVHDADKAEEIVQQALMKAWRDRDRMEDPAALPGWLSRVVVNEALASLRRAKVERKALKDRLWWRRQSSSTSEQLAMRESLIHAMEDLPEKTRLVVVLRLVEGLSGNEVKNLLDCSASEVSRRLHDGIARMREKLGAYDPTPAAEVG